ncbi:DeoR/GlpR family DNA-binding transcription regulator [Peribacillus sp. B-H-3]|uniref:DeoR/GlpR family DNA-binding transcription regulator n=1 Tax=Peribacillus sp. B-H-3 TaxID=3400420 RepID=UPI003B02B70E
MTQKQRLEKILDWLNVQYEITAEDIMDEFKVSRDTARRDLVKLEEDGEIVRVRGGAILSSHMSAVAPYREREMPKSKESIARKASKLIRDHDYVLFDTSTTVEMTARLMNSKNITAVTNSIDIVQILSEREGYTTYLAGGKFNRFNRNFTGFSASEDLKKYKTNVLFLGACGIGVDGLTSPDEEEAHMKNSMISSSEKVIVLADSTKFQKRFFHGVCGLSDIDVLITNTVPHHEIKQKLELFGIELIITEIEGG